MPAWTRWRANSHQSADCGADGGRREEWRGEEPDHEPDAGARRECLATEVVAGLLDVDLALGVLDHKGEEHLGEAEFRKTFLVEN